MERNNQKSKFIRFENVASRRVQKILDGLESLGKCSNSNNYEYTEKEVQKMFKAVKDKVKNIEVLFEENLNKKRKNIFKF